MKKILLALACALAGTPAFGQAPAPSAPDYAQDSAWLCLPGRADACGAPLATAALNPNGYGSNGQVTPAADPPIDCFYVYPTISRDAALNADLATGPEEQAVTAIQFARFASICRPFAPIYRQATLASIPAMFGGTDPAPILGLAYGDVVAAWRHYLQNHNQGRPFVLIGHSQGSIHLSQLLAREIEGTRAADRMLSALLIGFNIEVPEGETVGGTFRRTPLCTRAGQTNCVITYVSFRATNPPPPGSMFGRSARPGMTVACTNPAALGRRGSALLDSYWYAGPSVTTTQSAIDWSSQGAPPAPFLRTEGLVSAACVNRGPVGYLSVMVEADPNDARTDRIPGDVSIGGQIQPGWGLHLADMNLAMGDLLIAVEQQKDALARH
ncbi:MAG TPA: DUF3089 domain-containing protein [Allosphingosinicella sp.]|nr:DUF3089 domain-containing protein [Allosphingosinicella sp.]